MTQQHTATTAVRQGIETDLQHRAVVPPFTLAVITALPIHKLLALLTIAVQLIRPESSWR